MYIYVCVACRDQTNINVFRSSSIPSLPYFFLRQCFLLSQELTDSARLSSQQASGILLPASLVLGLQACDATLSFLNRIGDTKSGIYACMVLTFTTLSHLFRLMCYHLLKILDLYTDALNVRRVMLLSNSIGSVIKVKTSINHDSRCRLSSCKIRPYHTLKSCFFSIHLWCQVLYSEVFWNFEFIVKP